MEGDSRVVRSLRLTNPVPSSLVSLAAVGLSSSQALECPQPERVGGAVVLTVRGKGLGSGGHPFSLVQYQVLICPSPLFPKIMECR